ncbi:MAG: SUMF1/EgtB/PvdO family nonheme iron enzyme [Nannocystaceae bacterium]
MGESDKQEGRRLPAAERDQLAKRIIAGEIGLDEAAAAHWVSVSTLETWIIEYVLNPAHESGRDFPADLAFWGRIDDLAPVELLLLAAEGKNTCKVRFESGELIGRVWLDRGRIMDAEIDNLEGDQALIAILGMVGGNYGVVFEPCEQQVTVQSDTVPLLTAYRRRAERRADLLAKLAPLDRVLAAVPGRDRRTLDVSTRELLKLFDARNTIADVIELSRNEEFETLESIVYLVSGGFLREAAAIPRASFPGDATLDAPIPAKPPKKGPSRLAIGGLVGVAVVAWIGLAASEFLDDGKDEAPATKVTKAARPPEPPPVTKPVEKPAPPPEPCPDGMVFIEGGRYFMGSDSEKPAMHLSTPAHKVEVDSFCFDKDEVTVNGYRECSEVGECERAHRKSFWPRGSTPRDEWMEARKVHAPLCNEGAEGREQHPINCITWKQAYDYCRWAGKRLPSEAEWEYAARGRDGRVFPWGDEMASPERANVCGTECIRWREGVGLPPIKPMFDADDGFPGTAPVGSFPAGTTPTGIRDIVGNLFEWTADRFYEYGGDGTAIIVNPKGPDAGTQRIIRGGAFNSNLPEFTDPALRFPMDEEAYTHGIGFRCAARPRFTPG